MHKYIIVFLLFVTPWWAARAQKWEKIQSLKEQSVVKSGTKDQWRPFGIDDRQFVLMNLKFDSRDFQSVNLHLELPQSTSVFYNQTIYLTIDRDSTLVWPLDGLPFAHEVEQEFELTLFNSKGLDQSDIYLSARVSKSTEQKMPIEIAPLTRNTDNPTLEYIVLGSVMVIILFLLLAVISPKRFNDYFNYNKYYMLRIFDDRIIKQRTLSPENIYYLFFTMVLISFGLSVFFIEGISSFTNFEALENHSISNYLLLWLILFISVSGIYAAKLLLLVVFANLYRMPHPGVQYFLSIQYLLLHLLPLVAFSVMLYFNRLQISHNWLVFVIISTLLTYIVGLFLRFFKILKLSGFTYLHLFSYFCPTEIIPMLIGIKLILF